MPLNPGRSAAGEAITAFCGGVLRTLGVCVSVFGASRRVANVRLSTANPSVRTRMMHLACRSEHGGLECRAQKTLCLRLGPKHASHTKGPAEMSLNAHQIFLKTF